MLKILSYHKKMVCFVTNVVLNYNVQRLEDCVLVRYQAIGYLKNSWGNRLKILSRP